MGRIPSRGTDQFMLRFPDGMRDRIKHVAEQNGRSMNAEIIHRLENSLATDKMTPETFLGIMDLQHESTQKIAAALRKIADSVESLGSGAVELSE